jgi:formylglycine-generating enzyme required for sulfatase activity
MNVKKLLFIVTGIILIFTACKSPFFPEKNYTYNDPQVPQIIVHPQSDDYLVDSDARHLTVSASVNDGGTLSYQWYSNTVNSSGNGARIPNAASASYIPSAANIGTVYYYAVVTNTLNGVTASAVSNTAKITVYERYKIVLDIRGNVTGDTLTAAPDTALEGGIITLSYTVADREIYNQLDFDGVSAGIASVEIAESGQRTYTVNAADAINREIKIIAVFTHTALVIDHIEFENTEPHITVPYGTFTNAITNAHHGTGVITYSSSDVTVAAVSGAGAVTILKLGTTEITAKKAADAVYAYAEKSYTLTVIKAPGAAVTKPVTNGNQTTDSITVNTVYLTTATGQSVEYAISRASNGTGLSAWQSGTTFTGLNLLTVYYVYARSASNTNYETGPANVSAGIFTLDMVQIFGGTFTMGAPESELTPTAKPQHQVTLSGFYMGKYQVTQEQYQTVMGSNPSHFIAAVAGESGTPGKLPVESVRWYYALEFCNKLSIMEGLSPAYRINGSTDPATWPNVNVYPEIWNAVTVVSGSTGYRLPTEAQWEYACRAGTTTAYNTGNTFSDSTGWYRDNSGSKTHQVGLKPANAWGLYDMHGNVVEWCWDWYGTYTAGAQTNPTGPSSGSLRILRSGNYETPASGTSLCSYYRGCDNPFINISPGYYGFRLVRP